MSAEAKSSKGVRMYISKGGAAPATVVPTAITKANPAEVTAPDPVGAPYAVGQIVYCRDTGFPELDGKYFTIATLVGTAPDYTGFSLLGANTINSTGTLGANAEMDIIDSADLISMCLNNFAFALETPGTIPAGTYCNPSATLPASSTEPGTVTLGGWIDVDDPAYAELLAAEVDGESRVFSIVLPQDQGEIIAPISVITGITWDIPLDGGMAFTATGNLAAKPRHLF
jgi:hypothetical protein